MYGKKGEFCIMWVGLCQYWIQTEFKYYQMCEYIIVCIVTRVDMLWLAYKLPDELWVFVQWQSALGLACFYNTRIHVYRILHGCFYCYQHFAEEVLTVLVIGCLIMALEFAEATRIPLLPFAKRRDEMPYALPRQIVAIWVVFWMLVIIS